MNTATSKLKSIYYRCIFLCMSVVFDTTFASAQNHDEPSSYVNTDWPIENFSYKTISGFEQPLSCLDFSNGPFEIPVRYHSASAESKTIHVSLYVPKREFTETFDRKKTFRIEKALWFGGQFHGWSNF